MRRAWPGRRASSPRAGRGCQRSTSSRADCRTILQSCQRALMPCCANQRVSTVPTCTFVYSDLEMVWPARLKDALPLVVAGAAVAATVLVDGTAQVALVGIALAGGIRAATVSRSDRREAT